MIYHNLALLTSNRHHLINGLAFVFLYVLCWWIYKDYGISTDEPLHLTRVQQYFDQWRQIFEYGYVKNIAGGMRYGPLFNLLAHPFITAHVTNTQYLLLPYEIKHIVTFHVAFLMYFYIAYAFSKVCNFKYYGVLAVIILTLSPSLFGQIFFNPKDIPFAAGYTLASIVLAVTCLRMKRRLEQQEPAYKFVLEGMFAALIIAVCAGVRIAGLAVIPPALLVLLMTIGVSGLAENKKQIIILLVSTAISLIILLLLLYPSAIASPARWLITTINYFNEGTYRGEVRPNAQIPVDFFTKLPVLWFILGVAGLAAFVARFRVENQAVRNIGVMLVSQLLVLPMIMIIFKTKMYYQDQHYLFSYPAFAFFIGYAFIVFINSCKSVSIKFACLYGLAIQIAATSIDLILMHPYQYVYFNEISRRYDKQIFKYTGIKEFQPWDYFGISRKQLLEWINNNVEGRRSVKQSLRFGFAPNDVGMIYAKRRFRYTDAIKGSLVVSRKRPRPWCRTIHEEAIYLSGRRYALSAVYDCRKKYLYKYHKN